MRFTDTNAGGTLPACLAYSAQQSHLQSAVTKRPPKLPETIGERIERYMKARGWNQAQLAEAAGMSVGAIGNIIRGDAEPTISTTYKIARAEGVPVSYIDPRLNDDPSSVVPPGSPEEIERVILASPLSKQKRDAALTTMRAFFASVDEGSEPNGDKPRSH